LAAFNRTEQLCYNRMQEASATPVHADGGQPDELPVIRLYLGMSIPTGER